MKLKDLLQGVSVIETAADLETEIASVTYDTRKQIVPGSLFVAISGASQEGNRFIPMAMEKGAVVVVTAKKPEKAVPYILVESDRKALAQIGANYYGHPDRKMVMVGITGTNGKTSVTLILKHILEVTLGAKVGLIGTTGNQIGGQMIPSERTTPESLELQKLFSQMVEARCSHCIMEVSSHAIALDRVAGIHYDVAAFTNLTEDHLDFHRTMEAYCDTKAELFRRCDRGVINRDDDWYSRIAEKATCSVLTTSAKEKAGLWAKDIRLFSNGVQFIAVAGETEAKVVLPIPGRFSVYNGLTALGTAMELGVPLRAAAAALATASGVKGRVEVVPTPGKPYTVLIDYAHTPDGLENVLSSVKGFCKGRLIAVFGCGGDRDPMKRPIMGKIGVSLADHAIITSDNPRSEAPMAIIRDILSGVGEGSYEVIEDRRKAIRHAMDIGRKDDIIVLAGKGHETYQEICGVKHHLDEREEVAAYLAEMRES